MAEPTAQTWTGDDLSDAEYTAIMELLRDRRQFDLGLGCLALDPRPRPTAAGGKQADALPSAPLHDLPPTLFPGGDALDVPPPAAVPPPAE